MNEHPNLIEIRTYYDTDEVEPEDGWDWPAPPEVTEYRVESQMRADVLAKVGRPADDPAGVRLIHTCTEGGYSEYTVEHDYWIEVWVDDEGQSQRVFERDVWDGNTLPAFLAWIAPAAATTPAAHEGERGEG